MNTWNYTNQHEFILMGLTDTKEIQLFLSALFLLIYLVTVLGNIGMILIIHLDIQLHTPMYFFLTHLSFLDLSYSTVITPKTLQSLLTSTKNISYMGCFTQIYFFVLLAGTECFLLSSMAYDRYVAICNPLHYSVVMSSKFCSVLVTVSYMLGAVDSTVNMLCMGTLDFCKSNVIQDYFCDTAPLIALSCSNTHDIELIIFVFAGTTLLLPLIAISASYMSILSTVLKINSTSGKRKAFSTCASHIVAVIIYYGTLMFTHLKSNKSFLGNDQVASVFYTIVTPMLNPLIYSLRNSEVKYAVIRVIKKRVIALDS
ncbi:olfactory receptor 8H1-like [Phodopus roborovskii]|uniref:olfactory receptor 8H1-like n=1 Tax=Phodopus roborovskii TaxID=109678 RepID=UPI0021E496A1|nr:olfactory receptor 8H1-like [Phodopus roborovskii]